MAFAVRVHGAVKESGIILRSRTDNRRNKRRRKSVCVSVSGRTNLSYLQKYFRKVERESEAAKNNLIRQGRLLVSRPGSPSGTV